jgi:hypothetical protein
VRVCAHKAQAKQIIAFLCSLRHHRALILMIQPEPSRVTAFGTDEPGGCVDYKVAMG